AARPARLLVGDDLGAGDGAVGGERLAEVVRRGLEGEVADVQVLAHGHPLRALTPRARRHRNTRPGAAEDGGTPASRTAGTIRHSPAASLDKSWDAARQEMHKAEEPRSARHKGGSLVRHLPGGHTPAQLAPL